MTPNRQLFLALGLCLVALVGLVATACDSANPVAPSGTFLSVTASPSSIGLNETSTITVIGRRPDGSALFQGTEILLSTNLGTLDRTVIEVDSAGSARARLRGDGRTGTATVTASTGAGAGGEGGATMATVEVQVGQGENSRQSLVITANPDTIPVANGESTITVIGRNSDGTPVGAGLTVNLTTTLGSLSPRTPTTDSTGTATATLRAGGVAGLAEVTGFIGGSELVTAEVTIQDFIGPDGISLQAIPAQVSRSQAGTVTVSLEAQVENAAGQPARGVNVTFSSEFGNIQGARRVQTDETGVATVDLTVQPENLPADVSEFTVTASGAGQNGRESSSAKITVTN